MIIAIATLIGTNKITGKERATTAIAAEGVVTTAITTIPISPGANQGKNHHS